MTSKTISTYVSAGYTLAAKYDGLTITATGGVGGTGIYSNHFATVSNAGKVNAGAYEWGVSLAAGGYVLNRLPGVVGGLGIRIDGAEGGVANFGTITNQVSLYAGGAVTNGSYADRSALIGGPVSVSNAAGAVTNFARIEGGVALNHGGTVTNGTLSDTTASIGTRGVEILGGGGTVTNFGSILGTGSYFSYAVSLYGGGTVINGSASDTQALISGYDGVHVGGAAATIANFGTIEGARSTTYPTGVRLDSGGSITNGSRTDTTALIEGRTGVLVYGGGTVSNFGAIGSAGTFYGAELYGGGAIFNGASGAANNADAFIGGYIYGVALHGGASLTNFGVVADVSAFGGAGVYVYSGAITNGANGQAGALIEGSLGVVVEGVGTVTNFGTIRGNAGAAVAFSSSSDTLVVEAGCAFQGGVRGAGGTLDLDTGVGRLRLPKGESVTVSGSMLRGTFADFGVVEIGSAAQFKLKGAATILAGQALIDAGSLTAVATAKVANAGLIETTGAGALTIKGAVANTGTLGANGGTLEVDGAVTGMGMATIDGGTLDLASSFTQDVTFTGTTGVLELGKSRAYAGTVTGFSKAGGNFLDLDDIAFDKATHATYAGTKSGGVLTVTDGAHTATINLAGDYRSSTFVVAADGHGGTIIHDRAAPAANAPPAEQRFIAAMAGLGGGGAGLEAGATWRLHAAPLLVGPRAQNA